MFERYTEKARRVIFYGRYEASQFGSPYIETEHLLLGLLREDKGLTYRCLRSQASVESIRNQIEASTTMREKVSTSVDLPLSNECKRVLAYAAEEAERLHGKHIGTEHLLLGLLREPRALAAQLLQSQGLSLNDARKTLSNWQKTTETAHEIVEIHGQEWDRTYVQTHVAELQKFAWRKRQWKPLDILVEPSSGRIFFDVTLKDHLGFKLVAGGWPREFCALCHWELNADGGREHASGYTNGREWLCTECQEKFMEPLDNASE
jgi:ATP-dependent Clp protease ATP-binding subunit ClpC